MKIKDLILSSNNDKLILESLTILKEIELSSDNSVPIKGGMKKGTFQVGEVVYDYEVKEFNFPTKLPGDINQIKLDPLTVDIGFSVQGDSIDLTSNLPKGGKENLIKIYSTIFKIISTISKGLSPNNIMITSYDASGYFNLYNNLTKTNSLPKYYRKSIINWNHNGNAATSIVLHRNS